MAFLFVIPVIVGVALGGYVLEGTVLGRAAQAYFRTPDLKTLPANPLVSFEPEAESLAARIAEILPEAMARVATDEHMAFSAPVAIRVFATWESFERYTGATGRPAAVTQADRVSFSPKIQAQPERMPAVVMHELSHAMLHQHLGLRGMGLPAWFDEGLAVLVSDGGGAETVTEAEALAAIRSGKHFVPDEAESVFGHRFGASFGLSEHMFYRQAALFVRYLRDRDPEGFRRLLSVLADGDGFASALAAGYGTTIDSLWRDFLARVAA